MQAQTTNQVLVEAVEAYMSYCRTTQFNLEGEEATLESYANSILAACKTQDDCEIATYKVVMLLYRFIGRKNSVGPSVDKLTAQLTGLHRQFGVSEIQSEPELRFYKPDPVHRYIAIPRRVIRRSKEHRWAANTARWSRR